ncbi:F0F1 ATP synthase subunit gamma [Venenivibrio stagnispumantis]|uniref:ATP synthase gamma chain n=1 Tax=Venenivibrio stagnispumantis TaxID=407998 RepID=A0AA45WK88_9AQUI|nr:F0F1 ATP synthase subunit gamma [Venenivibrio stagnispumantis]MCW4573953.1 F0F1 ATP synthase subunit gamma [Venenivibrio stagnispumantis]SMP05920.1 F-type H+-transporting ATPase subunit gamma [Venenivibrio stagnispumantis]
MAKLSPRDIKRKINGIKNTQRITKAMKAVSAAKLRKAQYLLQSTRPYSEKLYDLINDLASAIDREAHPLLALREENKVDYVIITADRGLAGAFNSNVLKTAYRNLLDLQEKNKQINLILIGRKAVNFFKNKGFNIVASYEDIYRDNLNLSFSSKVGAILANRYKEANTDAIYLVNNEMITSASYETKVRKLFPIEPSIDVEKLDTIALYNIEPSKEEVLEELLKRYINFQLYRALVESNTAEHFARMIAMDNATKNAGEAIRKWTIIFNKARQEAITTELIDIINAAEAIK